jgi:hypothetical protein
MLKVGDRVRVLYAGPRPSLVGKKGTVLRVKVLPIEKYDYQVQVDGILSFGGKFYFYESDLKKL